MEKIKTKVCENEQCLSIEDELQLIKDIKSKGTERELAIEKLSHSKLRLVTAVAKTFKGCNLSMEELISTGNEGLVLAAEKYDEFCDFEYRLCLTPELSTHILAMGENVEVLEPIELRDEIKRRLKECLTKYEL